MWIVLLILSIMKGINIVNNYGGKMNITNNVVVEFNDGGYLIYSESFPGAFARGKNRDEALAKFQSEIEQYCRWAGISIEGGSIVENKIVQVKESTLNICDADSDVIFDTERQPLSIDEYEKLKRLVVKSAEDFKRLYESIPDKDATCLKERKTFYGFIPRTAREMYTHTNNVTNYYAGEIGVKIKNVDDIVENRLQALKKIEETEGYLKNKVYTGSYNEEWSLRKVMRRFIWHDRIHGRAMYKMAVNVWGEDRIGNPFCFVIKK